MVLTLVCNCSCSNLTERLTEYNTSSSIWLSRRRVLRGQQHPPGSDHPAGRPQTVEQSGFPALWREGCPIRKAGRGDGQGRVWKSGRSPIPSNMTKYRPRLATQSNPKDFTSKRTGLSPMTSTWIYADRTTGRHRHHRGGHRLASSGRSEPREAPAHSVHEQPQAARHGAFITTIRVSVHFL